MKLLLLLSVLIAVPGIIAHIRLVIYNRDKSIFSMRPSTAWVGWTYLTSGFAIFMVLLIWVVMYADSKSSAALYQATRITVEAAREGNVSEFERAALTTKIIEMNQILADAKYYNSTFVGDAISDDFADLEYLK
jgi:hypothetical protein